MNEWGISVEGWWTALYFSISFAVFFVLSLYFWLLVDSSVIHRDHPKVVKRRFISIFFTSLYALVVVYFYVPIPNEGKLFQYIGIRMDNIIESIFVGFGLTILPYCGQVIAYFRDPELSEPVFRFEDILWWRNIIVVIFPRQYLLTAQGPLAEEWIFRSCICPLVISGGWSLKETIFLTPLIFGCAHLHHFVANIFSKTNVKQWKSLALESLFQGLYTTVFGWYTVFLFVRTGNLMTPFVAHATCNYLGIPRLDFAWGDDAPFPDLKWKYLGGLIAFCVLLFPLTSPSYFVSVYYHS